MKEKTKFIDKLADFLQANRRVFLISAVILVVLLVGLIVSVEVRKSIVEKSTVLVENAEKTFSEWFGIEDEGKKSEKEKELVELAEKIMKDYRNTIASARAYFLLGNLAFEKKEWASAVERWEGLAKSHPRAYLAPIALMNASVAAEEMGDPKKARDILDTLIKGYAGNFPELPRALFSLGRLAEKDDQPQKALEYYNKVLDDHPSSSWTKLARNRIIYMNVSNKPAN